MDYQRDMRQSQKDVGDKIPSNYICVLFACIYTICLCNLLIILFAYICILFANEKNYCLMMKLLISFSGNLSGYSLVGAHFFLTLASKS